MQEIYFLRDGEDVNKLLYMHNIKAVESKTKIFGHRFAISKMGEDDILFVRNYYPLYEYTIQPNETILDIMARGYNITDNGEKVGDTIILSKPTANRYIVQPLDTIQSIANNNGVDIQYIVDVNHLKSTKLFIGQVLWI